MGLMNEFNSCSAKLVNHLIPLSDGQTEVVMSREFERLTMEIIGKVSVLKVLLLTWGHLCMLKTVLSFMLLRNMLWETEIAWN